MRKIILVLCLIVTSCFVRAKGQDSDLSSEYLPVSPKIIVNLKEWNSYLRADVQLLLSGHDQVKKISPHLPAVRHALIMLFSRYGRRDLTTSEQREALREKALKETKATLDTYSSSEGVKDLFFTEFLVQ